MAGCSSSVVPSRKPACTVTLGSATAAESRVMCSDYPQEPWLGALQRGPSRKPACRYTRFASAGVDGGQTVCRGPDIELWDSPTSWLIRLRKAFHFSAQQACLHAQQGPAHCPMLVCTEGCRGAEHEPLSMLLLRKAPQVSLLEGSLPGCILERLQQQQAKMLQQGQQSSPCHGGQLAGEAAQLGAKLAAGLIDDALTQQSGRSTHGFDPTC